MAHGLFFGDALGLFPDVDDLAIRLGAYIGIKAIAAERRALISDMTMHANRITRNRTKTTSSRSFHTGESQKVMATFSRLRGRAWLSRKKV